jgi:FkbM family methyltransferase
MLKDAVLRLVRPAFGSRTYTVRRGLAKGLKRRGGLGFVPRIWPSSVSQEEQFLLSLDLRGQTVYDVGALEGVFTLFFARAVGDTGRVVSFEPNPANYAAIASNVQLNGFNHVQVRQLALGANHGTAELVFPRWDPGLGSLDSDIQVQLRQEVSTRAIQVSLDSIDNHVDSGLPAPQFVKIDAEGSELAILHGMRSTMGTHKPAVFLEVHGSGRTRKRENAQWIVDFLTEQGYAIVHVESDSPIKSNSAHLAVEGHLYCT